MITIHHLGVSQSDRVVWLMEELGLPYQLKWYVRGTDRLAPPEFLALHPAATAPIIEDGDTLLAESGAIEIDPDSSEHRRVVEGPLVTTVRT